MSSAIRTASASKEASTTKKIEKTASEVLNEVVPDDIKNLRSYKNLVKEAEATETKRKKDKLLKEILEIATSRTEKPITTLSQFMSYFGNGKKGVVGGGKRAPRMTDEQKAKINILRIQGKPLSEIRAECGVTEPQLNSFLYAKKKS